MEIIIHENMIQSEKEFGLDDLPLASTYSKEGIVIQRKKINEIILANMEMCVPAINLPFKLFTEIQEEMRQNGWSKNYSHYQPIWFLEPSEQLEIKDGSEDKIISAKEFYDATMKQQLMALKAKFEEASKNGSAAIYLDFPLYKVIADRLSQQGWTVHVYNFHDGSFGGPGTLIEIK